MDYGGFVRKWLRRRKIRSWFNTRRTVLILFDLDGTLIDTESIFKQKITEFLYFLHTQLPLIESEKLLARFEVLNIEAFKLHGVNPYTRWRFVVDKSQKEFAPDQSDIFEAGLKILMQIYQILPTVCEGAIELLAYLNRQGFRVALVTHANEAWTEFKVGGLKLKPYFAKIFIISENGPKTFADWLNAIQYFGIDPEHVIVIGDNVSGDIIAAWKAGVRKLIWIDRGFGWKLYREGNLPRGTLVINSLAEICEVLAK